MAVAKQTFLGVIGGSGLYNIDGFEDITEVQVETPFGMPSDKIVVGSLLGKRIAFLPRHGRGHRFTPSEVNYRANIYALKKIGCSHILAVTAVGSLREDIPPGSIVVPKQLFDRTLGIRVRSFFGEGVVGHVNFADPYCPQLRSFVLQACQQVGVTPHDGGTLVVIEGPRFSTRAESHAFRSLGASIIGMTALPEASLAREAEMPYCTLALVTDYDCWREESAGVGVEEVIANLQNNIDKCKAIIRQLVQIIPSSTENPIFDAARYAIMTHPEYIPANARLALELLYGKYWNNHS